MTMIVMISSRSDSVPRELFLPCDFDGPDITNAFKSRVMDGQGRARRVLHAEGDRARHVCAGPAPFGEYVPHVLERSDHAGCATFVDHHDSCNRPAGS